MTSQPIGIRTSQTHSTDSDPIPTRKHDVVEVDIRHVIYYMQFIFSSRRHRR